MFRVADVCVFFFQAEDGIRDLVRSRGLGDVYKRQVIVPCNCVVEVGGKKDALPPSIAIEQCDRPS